MSTDVAAINAHYDFVLWYVQRIQKFPRSQRFVLGDRIELALLEVLDLLLEAKYSRAKAAPLGRANLRLEQIRFLTRLAADLGLLSRSQQLYAAGRAEEVGRQIGGWRKHQAGKRTK